MALLLTLDDLPDGFSYPEEFIRVVELGLTNLEPWWIMDGDLLRVRQTGIESRYPSRKLVVFAMRQDNDDVACWDLDQGGVVVVHDFASAGYETREHYSDFYCWFRQAIDDLVGFGS